jgi:ribosomal subunit interface protein
MASKTTDTTPLGMNVQVAGRHMAVGEALSSRISQELQAGIGKYFERGGSAEVTVGKANGHSICVDISVVLHNGQQLVAKGEAGDAHTAFDAALEKAETRIRRYKRRLVNHHAAPVAKGAPEFASVVVLRAPDDDDDTVSEEWGSDGSAGAGAPAAMIIAESEQPLKTQTVSMAVMELDLADCPVLLFRNAAHGGLSVVYRRKDGNIGWIDPERTRVERAGPADASHAQHARM